MNYQTKERIMNLMLGSLGYTSPAGFRSVFKGVPIENYESIKLFIDFTKYFVMFRGPRNRGDVSTRKCNAKAFDVYQRDVRDMAERRIEREAFLRGVAYATR